MKYATSIARAFPATRCKLYLAIAAQMLFAAGAHAGPEGGVVVAGDGQIDQTGLDTTIIQNSDRLAVDWTSFNIQADEQVQFVQPSESSVALNRILGNEASQIFGRLDANGHVILMNPNGVFFGEGATVNVGGLVASGLAINPDDFMNGGFALHAVEGLDGAVINQGIINAATGGNVVLVGQKVENQGLISAKLGSVTLAAGKEVVLTFDDQGLLGVRVSKEILKNELGMETAVNNSGTINAEGGRILLTGSVSQDIFSRAVNSEGLNAKTSVLMHDDGSFTLGGGAAVVNAGTLNASADSGDAGQIVVIGENIQHSGAILTDSQGSGKSGDIELHAKNTTLLTHQNTLSATAAQGTGGAIKVLGDRVGVFDESKINASGVNGGGDIHIGGGFQGKNPNLRNASRTVIGKDTVMNADALQNGDGGEVIVWADETTAFTGAISVRGGADGGDGGFVEVSGKENLRFDGAVDRTAVDGENGTLLLDPKYFQIVTESSVDDLELDDQEVQFLDGTASLGFRISTAAIATALGQGDVVIKAADEITTFEPSGNRQSIAVAGNNSLILEAGEAISLNDLDFDLGAGSLIINATVQDCGGAACPIFADAFYGVTLSSIGFSSSGDLFVRSTGGIDIYTSVQDNTVRAGNFSLNSLSSIDFQGSYSINSDLTFISGTVVESGIVMLPSGGTYALPALRVPVGSLGDPVIRPRIGTTNIDVAGNVRVEATGGVDLSGTSWNFDNNTSLGDVAITAREVLLPEFLRSRSLAIRTGIGGIAGGGTINTTESILLSSEANIALPEINSGGDLIVESTIGNISSSAALNITAHTSLTASENIELNSGFSLASITGDFTLNAGRALHIESFSESNLIEINTGGDVSFTSNSGSINLLRGAYNARSFEIDSANGSLWVGLVELNAEADVDFNLEKGIFSSDSGYMTVNAGSFGVEATNLGMQNVELNIDSGKGSGEIILIANMPDPSVVAFGEVWLPQINPSGNYDTTKVAITAYADGAGIYSVISESLDLEGPIFNVNGPISIAAFGNIELPRINMWTSDSESSEGLAISTIGKIVQRYDIYTNSGNLFIESRSFASEGGVIDTAGGKISLAATGDILLESPLNKISSIEILKAQNVVLANSTALDIAGINAANLRLDAITNITQSGSIHVSGEAIFNLSELAGLTLESAANNFNEISINSSSTSASRITNSDDLVLADITASSNIQIISLGEGALVSQKAGSQINLASGGLMSISADNIHLGESASTIQMDGGSLTLTSEQSLSFSGAISGVGTAPSRLSASATAATGAELNINATASFTGFDADASLISLGDGNDVINVAAITPFYIETGLGNDTFNLLAEGLSILNLNGNEGIDTLIGANGDSEWFIEALNEGQLISGGLVTGFLDVETLIGGDAQDSFIVSTTAIDGMSLNGGGGNNLIYADDDSLADNSWTVDGANTGTLNEGLSFTSIQNLEGNTGSDTFTLSPNSSIGNISAGAGDDTFILANNITTGLLDGRDGTDTLNLNGLNSIYTYLNELIGGDGVFTVVNFEVENNDGGNKTIVGVDGYDALWSIDGDNSVTVTATLGGVETINRFTGANRLEGASSGRNDFVLASGGRFVGEVVRGDLFADNGLTNHWVIDGPNSGTLRTEEDGSDISFSEIANIGSGTGSNIFELRAGAALTGLIGAQPEATIFANADSINNNWILNESGAGGSVNGIDFFGPSNTRGSGGNDTFVMLATTSEIKSIDGGLGNNTLELQSSQGALINLETETVYDISTNNINTYVANGGDITGANSDSLWILNNNASSVTYDGQDGAERIVQFSGFDAVFGGSAADEFRLVSGTSALARIEGGGGEDSLVGPDVDVRWQVGELDNQAVEQGLLSYANQNIVFNEVENLAGGSGMDEFHLYGGVNNLVGGAGDNSLWIYSGSSLVWEIYAKESRLNSDDLNFSMNFSGIQAVSTNALGSTDTTNTIYIIDYWDRELVAQNFDLDEDAFNTLDYSRWSDPIAESAGGSFDLIIGTPGSEFRGFWRDSVWLIEGDQISIWADASYSEGAQFGAPTQMVRDFDFYIAGPGNDDFVVNGDNNSVFIQGSEGINRIFGNPDNNAINNNWVIERLSFALNDRAWFEDIQSIQGNAGNDTFTFFSNSSIGNINAGAGDDTFILANNITAGLLDGGEGQDTLNRDGLNSIYTYLNQVIGGDAVYTTANIEIESNTGGSTTVVGVDGYDAQWSVNGDGLISVTANSGGTEVTNTFNSVTRLEGGSGTDEFILSGGTIAEGIFGGDGDSLLGDNIDNIWIVKTENSGALETQEGEIIQIFGGIANLIGGSAEDFFNIAVDGSISGSIVGGAGEDTLLISSGDVVNDWQLGALNSVGLVNQFSGIEKLEGNVNNDIFTFLDETEITRIEGGEGDNTVNWGLGEVVVNLCGCAIADTLQFDDINVFLADPTFNNTIIGLDEPNTWTLTAPGTGTVNDTSFSGFNILKGGSGEDTFVFSTDSSIDTINAGAGDDTFILANNIIAGLLDGGEGLDTLNRGDLNSIYTYLNQVIGGDAIYTVANIESQTSTGANSTVVAVNGYDAQWTINGDGLVSVTATDTTGNSVTNTFNSVTRLEGGTGVDEFILRPGGVIAQGIVSGSGDSLRASDTTNTWTIDAADGGELAVQDDGTILIFRGIANLIGGTGSDLFDIVSGGSVSGSIDGGIGADTLRISDAAAVNNWQLAAQNAVGLVNQFRSIENLVGNANNDHFVIGGITDVAVIDGGAGANRLTGFDQINSWNLTAANAGSVSGLAAFSNIQTLVGGSGSDTFTLVTGGSITEIYGGTGDDSFVLGRDVTADNIYGEAGDDSFDVDLGLILSGALDGGTGGEVAGDYLNLNKFTLLTATDDLEALLGFAFRNFERIDQPNTQGIYFGGDAANFWFITGENQGRLEIRDGANSGTYDFSDVHSLRGGSGEDVFIFANDTAAVTTIIDGGSGAGVNTLDLSAQGLINQWLVEGANSGRVSNDSNTTGNLFTNIAYLIGGGNRDNFSLQAGGTIAGSVDGGLGDDQLAIGSAQTSTWALGGTAGHSVTGIARFEDIENLVGSAGEDTFNVLSETLDVARIDGAAGSDTLNFQHANQVVLNLRDGTAGGLQVNAIERFISGNIGSTLVATDASNSWTLDGVNSGSIRYLVNTGGDVINVAFDGFGNLLGGAADDQFNLLAGAALSGVLDAGAGNDGVNLQALTTDVHVAAVSAVTLPTGVSGLKLDAVEQLLGNGRTWLYGASDQSYTWTINGQRSGQVTSTLVDANNQLLAFENLSAIVGGAHDDIFRVTIATPLLSLDGGASVSADLVDYSQVNGNLRINLATALSGQNGVLAGVEGIRGNNAGPDSKHTAELVAADGENLWVIGTNGSDLADGINDGRVTSAAQTIQFLDFNQLTGGAGVDSFELDGGVLLGTLSGGAGNDVFELVLAGANTGTLIDGGLGPDSLTLSGGDAAGLMTYTAAANGGEFDYSLADVHFKLSHQAVETIRDNSRAQTLEIRGSNQADTISLGNDRFWFNGGSLVEHTSKARIAVRSGINDTIEIADHLTVADSLTLANGNVIANDPANSSITAAHLILDATRDVGLASARLRTSVDELSVRSSAGDIYLQEQNGLNLAELNANGVFDLLLLNGDLTSSAPLAAADVFRVSASNGDITLRGDNQLRDDVALSGARVELHNASTLTLVGITAEDLILRTQRGIEGDGPLVVSGLTEIDAQGDVRLDFSSNDFNRVRVTNAWNLTLVDQNTLELLDINASGTVVVRSANNVTLNNQVAGGTGVDVSSGSGSVNQNGSIVTGSGSVVVEAGNGEVNFGDDARIVANGGSVNISAGTGNVNMGADTRIAANGGNVNIEAADSVVVAEVVSSGDVAINAGSGSVTDGNGGATNVVAGVLQSSSNTGFGSEDALETQVGVIDVTTNTGNVGISNTGDVTVEAIRTEDGSIAVTNEGNVDLAAGSVSATDGEVGGDVSLDVNLGSVRQTGPTSVPAITGGVVLINAPQGAVGEGNLSVNADVVRITALSKAGEIFVNPGADKIEYFSGSFKFEDQLLSVEPLDDIDPAIFTNVRSYFYNDISLLLPSDQRYDDEDEEEEESKE
jgi:filamentous hemagglutinin family protein